MKIDLHNPIPLTDAMEMVNIFRGQSPSKCIVYKRLSVESYISTHFSSIVNRHHANTPPEGYDWEVSFHFMMKNGWLDFCVAPILVKRDAHTDELLDLLDCFVVNANGASVSAIDPNISYTYDYAAYDSSHPTNPSSIYNDGNMFP